VKTNTPHANEEVKTMGSRAVKITILINQKPYHFEVAELAPADFRVAVGAPSDHEVWLVVHSPDPEGQLPVDDIQITGPTEIKSGQRFRVVPPGTFGA
jgi:hypothetical protein